MKYRKLRIAVSSAAAIGCLLIMTAWVRSHRLRDFYEWSWGERNYQAFSNDGVLSVTRSRIFSGHFAAHGGSLPVLRGGMFAGPPVEPPKRLLGLGWQVTQNSVYVGAHYGCFLLLGLGAAWAQWWPWSWRFSLRTLLIVTTLAGLMLGLSVWAMQ
jgi:hypothetical protein